MKLYPEIYKRTEVLKNELNRFLGSLIPDNPDRNFLSELDQDSLINLKMGLADVNNVMTLLTTVSCAEWLVDYFSLDETGKSALRSQIDNKKPNTNGYDILIKNLAAVEIKCIVPIRRGRYYGAAQWIGILKDAVKLDKDRRIKNYYKIIGLLDMDSDTREPVRRLIQPSDVNKIRTRNPMRKEMHLIKNKLEILDDHPLKADHLSKDRIYIKMLRIDHIPGQTGI